MVEPDRFVLCTACERARGAHHDARYQRTHEAAWNQKCTDCGRRCSSGSDEEASAIEGNVAIVYVRVQAAS